MGRFRMSKPPRKICFLTGKRGGFGALIPTFRLIKQDPSLELFLIATDMHLSKKFGNTISEVDKWVEGAYRVPIDQEDDQPVSRAKALGKAMSGIAECLLEIKPDIFVVLGDRGEVYSAVSAALHLAIPVAHIQGGDVSGNVDEMMRHAITKMSHIHFPSTNLSAARIKKMGEDDWRIHTVGDPHVDMLLHGEYTSSKKVRLKFGIMAEEQFALILVHPETLHPENSYQNMRSILSLVKERSLKSIIVYPCSDHGYQGILDAIDEYKETACFNIQKNIEAPDFWGLQAEASVFIGNSSAGLIEAPYFSLPVINIGLRQVGREHANNLIQVTAVNKSNLESALDLALSNSFQTKISGTSDRPFGDGNAAEKMVEILKETDLNRTLFEKRIAY